MAEKPLIYIHGFGTDWVPEYTKEEFPDPLRPGKMIGRQTPTGKTKPRDWVEYSPVGSANLTVVREWIERLNCPLPLTGKGGENPAVIMANMRWNAIEPRYEAWKKGQEIPSDGTPLSAWNGVSRQVAEILRSHGVYTVEELARLTDTHKQRMNIMGLGNCIEGAKRFVAASDKNTVSAALEKKDAEIADLRAQMAELIGVVKEGRADVPPKRRGRPPKAEAAAA